MFEALDSWQFTSKSREHAERMCLSYYRCDSASRRRRTLLMSVLHDIIRRKQILLLVIRTRVGIGIPKMLGYRYSVFSPFSSLRYFTADQIRRDKDTIPHRNSRIENSK
jgi:hypothetical protein